MAITGKVPTAFILLAAGVTSAALAIGIIIGHYMRDLPKGPCLGNGVPENINSDIDPEITEKMKAEISANEIRENLR